MSAKQCPALIFPRDLHLIATVLVIEGDSQCDTLLQKSSSRKIAVE